jgi:mannose-6-phosphate isomerase
MKRSTESAPFLLSPAAKDYVWGGTRLNDFYAKNIPLDRLAETWECSTHPDGLSRIASGGFAGMTLRDFLKDHPGTVSDSYAGDGDLPVLVKLIDSASDLSVQVHPDDVYAALHENGERGKTEMWYVIEADPGASLICGFAADTDRGTVARASEDGTLPSLLKRVPVRPGDVFFIRPGTVHAIGAGILLGEVQQSSNVTYRLYDWGRVGTDGKPRQLHLEKALDVLDFRAAEEHSTSGDGTVCDCEIFRTDVIETPKEAVGFGIGDTCRIIVGIKGEIVIRSEGASFCFWAGDCVFVPAGTDFSLEGEGKILMIFPKIP